MSPPDLDSLTPAALRSRRTLKWTTYDADVLALWVAEMDYPTAPPILEAVTRAVRDETLGYPSRLAERELGEAVAAWSGERFGVAVDPSRAHSVGNVMHGLRLALTYWTAPADPVILTTPVYMPFFDVVQLAGRPQVHVPMTRGADGRHTLDLHAIDAAFRAGARTLVLCHPYNPLGRAFTRAELGGLAEVVVRHRGRVISDEIHGSLLYDDAAHVPYAALSPQTAAHTITVTAASKAWNLPGLMCAQVITSNDADEQVWRAVPLWDRVGASTLGVVASTAAYRHGLDWLTEALAHLDRNRHLVAQAVAGWAGVSMGLPEATYLAWLDFTALGLPEEPADWLLRESRVALSAGLPFRAEPNGFARLNFATPRPILDEALARIDSALAAFG